jgi:hypothetical protein
LPGRLTLPDTLTIFVPVEVSTPSLAYCAPPSSMMRGTVDSVSTLLISVGPW